MKHQDYFSWGKWAGLLLLLLLPLSCKKESDGAAVKTVTALYCVPDDESVTLYWHPGKDSSPSDYRITWFEGNVEKECYTGGATEYTLGGLTNDVEYLFSVAAAYGDELSKVRTTQGKPTALRFKVEDFGPSDVGNAYAVLSWKRPDSDRLTGYRLFYGIEGGDMTRLELGLDVNEYRFDGLTNDKTYLFSIVAVYPKGESLPSTTEAIPAAEKPYHTNISETASGMPITYSYDFDILPGATDIKWTFPDGKMLTGANVTYAFSGTGRQSVRMTAVVNGEERSWSVMVTLKDFLIEFNDWYTLTSYNGCKGTAPVFSPDGKTVYVNTFRRAAGVYAFHTDSGLPKWRFIPDDESVAYNGLSVNPVTGDIYFANGDTDIGTIYAIKADGTLRWSYPGIAGSKSTTVAVSKDGTKLFHIDYGGNLIALNADTGAELWAPRIIGVRGAALLVNGNELMVTVCAKNPLKTVYFINTNTGADIASLSLDCASTELTGIAVSNDKKYAYVPLIFGSIAKINLSTHKLEKMAQIDKPVSIIGTAGTAKDDDNRIWDICVAPNGNLFCARKVTQKNLDKVGGAVSSNCYILDASLNILKTFALSAATPNVFNYSHPCCDSKSNFYLAEGKSPCNIYRLNLSGRTILSTVGTGEQTQNVMGGMNILNGVLYCVHIGSKYANGRFTGVFLGADFDRGSSWSGVGGDQCCTNCVK